LQLVLSLKSENQFLNWEAVRVRVLARTRL
jgi:hypothetical protein